MDATSQIAKVARVVLTMAKTNRMLHPSMLAIQFNACDSSCVLTCSIDHCARFPRPDIANSLIPYRPEMGVSLTPLGVCAADPHTGLLAVR
jgi:hypothetical protein